MAHDPSSPVLRFYEGGPDHRGRTLAEILAKDDAWLERTHDYIQWVFPLPERSPYNPNAPVLLASDRAAFRAAPALRHRLLDGFGRMLAFYGFEMTTDRQDRCGITRLPSPGRAHWITPHDHNFLRISRILRSLHLLGCPQPASAFLAVLEPLAEAAGDIVGVVTLSHWRAAAKGERLA